MSQKSIQLNRAQNTPDFILNLEGDSTLFKKSLLSKTLEPPQINLDNPRTVIVKCLQKGCR